MLGCSEARIVHQLWHELVDVLLVEAESLEDGFVGEGGLEPAVVVFDEYPLDAHTSSGKRLNTWSRVREDESLAVVCQR